MDIEMLTKLLKKLGEKSYNNIVYFTNILAETGKEKEKMPISKLITLLKELPKDKYRAVTMRVVECWNADEWERETQRKKKTAISKEYKYIKNQETPLEELDMSMAFAGGY